MQDVVVKKEETFKGFKAPYQLNRLQEMAFRGRKIQEKLNLIDEICINSKTVQRNQRMETYRIQVKMAPE
jgi:hypothetical protein